MDPLGPNLRRLYLPGLEPLKLELSRLELLLATHLPQLHAHLLAAGLPAVLYASQWIMTVFACPFPVHFAARLLDVILQVRSRAATAGVSIGASYARSTLPPVGLFVRTLLAMLTCTDLRHIWRQGEVPWKPCCCRTSQQPPMHLLLLCAAHDVNPAPTCCPIACRRVLMPWCTAHVLL